MDVTPPSRRPFSRRKWLCTRHIFRFSRSGKRQVNVNCLMSKHSDYNVIFCHDPMSQLAIDASSSAHMKLMRTTTDSPRNAQMVESLR